MKRTRITKWRENQAANDNGSGNYN